jgi:hypothetical protein
MRWFASITLLALFALFAACSAPNGQPRASAPDAGARADAQTVTVYKSPT